MIRQIALLFIPAVSLLASCKQASVQELPFEVLTYGQLGESYTEKEPALLIYSKPEDVQSERAGFSLSTEMVDLLGNLDYDRDFAILIFRGTTSGLIYEMPLNIQSIERRSTHVFIYVEYPGPPLDKRVYPAGSSPYLLVRVSKDGAWGKKIRFELVNHGELIADTSQVIP